jgi:hypothetical protein
MKQNKITKEKKIRRLLLLNSDKEMQIKIKKKNPVLINSMTPLELENSFQLYKDIINISESTYTNILEKYIVERFVDINKNINYYYSESIENKKRKKAVKKYNKYKGVYSAKIFGSNFDDFIDDEEEREEKEEDEKEEIIKSIIPFINRKKSVVEGKIIKDKSYSKLRPKINNNYKEDINNNICFDTWDLNSNNNQQYEKQKKQKMLDINYKLIYYCYTYLKRKRPLIVQNNDNNISIYGLEIEEENFNQVKLRASTVKKNKEKNKLQINDITKIRSKSTKNINRKKAKKNKYLKDLKDLKDINKKNRICVTNRYNNNSQSNNLDNELSNLKSKIKKYISIRSEKKYKIKMNKLLQDKNIEKCRTNSMFKKHNKFHSNENYIINVGESPLQNIISKLDTKTTSFDDNSSSMENKNRGISNNKRKKETNINSKIKEKAKILKKNGRRKFKFITHNKLKHQCLEEIKLGNNKPNKKSLKEPIRAQFMNSLQKKVGFNFEENKKNFYKNKKASSKISLINKIKSKSKKDCIVYDDNSASDEDEVYFKKRMLSYGIKDKNINSIHSKRKYNK